LAILEFKIGYSDDGAGADFELAGEALSDLADEELELQAPTKRPRAAIATNVEYLITFCIIENTT